MLKIKTRHILTFFIVCLSATTLYAQTCSDTEFYNKLGASESGGCGATQYDCLGPVINNGGMHQGDRPLGKYQFMPKTLASMGIDSTNFVGNPAAQEAAIQQFVAMNDQCLQNQGAYAYIGQVVDGVTITKSGLLGAAHLGGCGGAANWVKGGGARADQLGTSLADYAAKFGGYGVAGGAAATDGSCGTGVANAADQFAQSQAQGLHHLLGCDPRVLNQSVIDRDALQQVNAEIIRAVIQPPVPAEQMTCIDQAAKIIDATGPIHANPTGPLSAISSSIGGFGGSITGGALPKFDQIVTNNITSELNNLVNIPGSISSQVSTIWSNVSSAFGDPSGLASSLFGTGPLPSASADCTVMEDTWLLNQCVDIGPLPNLTDIMNNQLGKITGAIAALPDRAIDQVCSVAQSQISGLTGAVNNLDNVFEDAVDAQLSPITDGLNTLNNNATGAINNLTAPLN